MSQEMMNDLLWLIFKSSSASMPSPFDDIACNDFEIRKIASPIRVEPAPACSQVMHCVNMECEQTLTYL